MPNVSVLLGHNQLRIHDHTKTQIIMSFKEVNLQERTVYLNTDLVQIVERGEGGMAVITMADGAILQTNEDYEELLHLWRIVIPNEGNSVK